MLRTPDVGQTHAAPSSAASRHGPEEAAKADWDEVVAGRPAPVGGPGEAVVGPGNRRVVGCANSATSRPRESTLKRSASLGQAASGIGPVRPSGYGSHALSVNPNAPKPGLRRQRLRQATRAELAWMVGHLGRRGLNEKAPLRPRPR